MPEFSDFKTAVQLQFEGMKASELFRTAAGKDEMWSTYLGSFPDGSNEIFRERTEHDCQCCKQFIRACGNMVAINDNMLLSIWDVEIGGYYQVVADAMSGLVKSKAVNDVFLHDEPQVGTNCNHQLLDSGETLTWEHFYLKLPSALVMKKGIGTALSDQRSRKEVFMRSLAELSLDSAQTILELIEQNGLYRGEEHKAAVEAFITHKTKFDQVEPELQDNFCWATKSHGIRNTVIGSLLVDLSEGKDLDFVVRGFETKVAPTNYKRPTAVVTQTMIRKAQEEVAELGIGDSLPRRHAVVEDLTINNVLFADRTAKQAMDVFDELADEAPTKVKNLDKVDEVTIDHFISDILPKATSLELLTENKHINNLMSLIAPQHLEAPGIFKWGNNFSWAYNGEVADSIKERVKQAGGNIEALLRASLGWFNYDDLDIHVVEPSGHHIYYGNKRSHTSGALDVDMNVDSGGSRNAVENIIWTDKAKMDEGTYRVFINNYTPRETVDVGFDAEIEFDGVIHTFHHAERVVKDVEVAQFSFSRENGIEFIKSLPSIRASKEVWGLTTQKFHKVSLIMHSPNHWDREKTGNRHYFFILDGCKNDKAARGFFNEFLDEDLSKHRKVFEVLGSKLRVEPSDNQLSGLGFSTTQKNHVFCKVTGSFTRTIKIIF